MLALLAQFKSSCSRAVQFRSSCSRAVQFKSSCIRAVQFISSCIRAFINYSGDGREEVRCALLSFVAKEFGSVTLEAWPRFRLREDVSSVLRSSEIFQAHHVEVDLFDHVVNACEKVLTSFMIAGELLGQGDETFVVDVEGSGLKLFEAEFFQDGTKVDDVLCSFDCRVRFCFGRAEGDDCLLAASGAERAGALAEGETDSCGT